MARLSKDELIEKIKKYIGDRTDDETIEIIEDISDSVDASNEESEWKQKYEENDKMWRDKYISRFFAKREDESESSAEHEEEEKEYTSFEDLFEEEEN